MVELSVQWGSGTWCRGWEPYEGLEGVGLGMPVVKGWDWEECCVVVGGLSTAWRGLELGVVLCIHGGCRDAWHEG